MRQPPIGRGLQVFNSDLLPVPVQGNKAAGEFVAFTGCDLRPPRGRVCYQAETDTNCQSYLPFSLLIREMNSSRSVALAACSSLLDILRAQSFSPDLKLNAPSTDETIVRNNICLLSAVIIIEV